LNAGLMGLLCAIILLTPAQTTIAQLPPSLTISPTSLVFPKTPVGSKLPAATIIITNPASSTIRLEEIIVSGIDFLETTDCGKELAAGAKCSIQIIFQPATSGERIGSLVIAASDSNLPHFVVLAGTGE
jgi:hypothetical protein